METLAFLRLVTPSRGLYFAAVPAESGRGFRHHLCETHADLTAKVRSLDDDGATVYFALGSYREPRVQRYKAGVPFWVERVQDNVQFLRSFWLDLDVGESVEGRPPKYASQGEAATALGTFVKECGLPEPLLVSSGYGLHVYWPLTDDVMEGQWKATATALKSLTAGLKLLTDPTRTSDSASILRPVGTHNRKIKDGVPTKMPVVACNTAEPSDYSDFHKRVARAIKEHKIVEKAPSHAKVLNKQINEGAATIATYGPTSAHLVADQCNQIRMMREKGGDIAEPVWFAAIQVLNKTIEAPEIIHLWSSGYKDYSRAETDAKIERIVGMGPSLCSTFESRNSKGCENCKFAGKIATPLQLGIQFQEAIAPKVLVGTVDGEDEEVELPGPADPFKRGGPGQEGLYIDTEGVMVKFYPYDLFPVALEYDEADQFETTRIRHWLPKEGWKEFAIQSSLVHSPRDFNMAMGDKHVKYLSDGIHKDTMRQYMGTYLQKLQEGARVNFQHERMGWMEDNTQFLLGKKMYMSDGSVRKAGISRDSLVWLDGFKPKGDLATWVKLTERFGLPGYEPHAFTMMLAFGAPLIQILSARGALVNMVGPTGHGKSSMGRMVMSVYGDGAESSNDSTTNARLQKLGAHANLPMYIDEISLIEPIDLSKLAYAVANGLGRERLKSNSSAAKISKWRTIVLTSSNHNLHERLTLSESHSSAESMRLFEYDMPIAGDWHTYSKTKLHPILDDNHGLAGEIYIRHIVQMDKAVLKAAISNMEVYLSKLTNSDGGERFWMWTAASAIVGGIIAKQLGLIAFEPTLVYPWLRRTLDVMRHGLVENKTTEVTVLANFMDEFQANRLNIRLSPLNGSTQIMKFLGPGAKLTQRLETDSGRLYINRKVIKAWAISKGQDFGQLATALREKKILLPKDKRITLGKDTQWGSFQDWCWEIDLHHPECEALLSTATLDTNVDAA